MNLAITLIYPFMETADHSLLVLCLPTTTMSFCPTGAVPPPESLLFTTAPLTHFQPVSTQILMASVSPDTLTRLQETCQGSMQCVHDILATKNTDLGLQTLQDQKQLSKLAVVFGEYILYELSVVSGEAEM